MTDRIERHASVILFVVLAIALILRLWSIDFGLPYAYHIDERSYVVGALNLGQGEINGYPQQVGLVNVLFGEYAAYFVVGRLIGLFASTQDFARSYYVDPTLFYLLGRLTSAVLGVVSCWTVYLLGAELRNRVTGLVAAMLVAVNFLHVRESHFTTPDVPQALGLTVVLLLCLKALKSGRMRSLYIASFFGGIVIAWKWASLPLILPLIFVACQIDKGLRFQEILQRWVFCGLLTLLGFVVFSPQLLLFPAPYIEWAKRDYITASVGGYGGFLIDTVPGWLFYLNASYIGAGVLGLGMSLAGLLLWTYRLLWRRDRQAVVFLLLFAGYFVLMARSQRYFVRYAVPMVPILALAAADAFNWLREHLEMGNRWRLSAVLVAIPLIATVQPMLKAPRANILWSQEDTRTIAKQWIEQNIPDGAKIATDWMVHGVPLSTPDVPSPISSRIYQVTEVNGLGLYDHSIEFYRAEGFDYLITSSYISDLDLVDHDQENARDTFYRSLDTNCILLQEFRPYDGNVEPSFVFDGIYGPLTALWQYDRPGPTLKLYEVDRNR
ncbi:MAG: glycosyltransferase family 39 protein [Anaerolineae bacterium]|nr:glycosyltransferase family 39 protein [Anaerolineae bacterium]